MNGDFAVKHKTPSVTRCFNKKYCRVFLLFQVPLNLGYICVWNLFRLSEGFWRTRSLYTDDESDYCVIGRTSNFGFLLITTMGNKLFQEVVTTQVNIWYGLCQGFILDCYFMNCIHWSTKNSRVNQFPDG